MTIPATSKRKLVDSLLAVLLFLACFTLFSSMRRNLYFLDELDNFANGIQIAKGSLLYRDIFSQHMPLMYYLCALMAKLGIHTIVGFRLAWYAVLSIMYTAIFWRYRKDFGRVPLLLWPIFYLLAISTQSLCFAILSEQMQVVGMVVLALEFLRFCRTKEVPWHSAVAISVSINIAFLSAFMALFGCAVIVCAYIILEIYDCIRQKMNFGQAVGYLWKKYWLTILLTLLPIIVLALSYLVQGAFQELIYYTFSFNTEIYSKYSGVGDSPLSAITGAFHLFGIAYQEAIEALMGHTSNVSLATAVLLIGKDIFIGWMVWKRKWGQAFVLQLCFILCGVRGFFNFHSLSTISLAAIFTALLIGQLWIRARGEPQQEAKNKVWSIISRYGSYSAVILIIGITIYGNGGYFWERRTDLYPTAWEFEPKYSSLSNEGILNRFAEPNEYILQNINAESLYITTNVRMAPYSTGASPWAWEATRERSLQLLKEKPPRFAIFDPEYTVFKVFKVRDYAPDLTAFIKENYQPLKVGGDHLWVRNDWLPQIIEELLDTTEYVPQGRAETPTFSSSDTIFEQYFVAKRSELREITIRPATFELPYDGTIKIELWKEKGEEYVASWQLRGRDVVDSAPFVIYQKEMSNSPIELKKGETYRLSIQPHSPTKAVNFSLWMRQAPEEDGQAFINGEQQPYNYDIIIL